MLTNLTTDAASIVEYWLVGKIVSDPTIMGVIGYNDLHPSLAQFYKVTAPAGNRFPYGLYRNQTQGTIPTRYQGKNKVARWESLWALVWQGLLEHEDTLALLTRRSIEYLGAQRQQDTSLGRIQSIALERELDPWIGQDADNPDIWLAQRGCVFRIGAQFRQ